MAVPVLITDLSTTAASNSPAGSDAVFPDLDNYIRALSSFIAQNYAEKAALASPTFTGTLTAASLTTTGNTTLGDNTADTLTVAAGGLVRNSNGFGVNNTLSVPLPIRVQAEGSNDVGLEWQRVNSTTGLLLSYNRATPGYGSWRYDGVDHQFYISGSTKWTLDSSGHWAPTTTNTNNLGASGNRTANVYSVLGNFSGTVTADDVDAATLSITQGEIISGTYTPTLTARTNVAASTAYVCQYMRVGSVVTVSGKVDVDPTVAGSTATGLGISLPIASNLAANEQCAGTGVDSSGSQHGAVAGDAGNDRADLAFLATSSADTSWFFSFTYQII